MKAKLDQSYFWNRRSWGPGEVEIPNDLAIALGLAVKPESGIPDSQASVEKPEAIATPAVALINSSQSAVDIAVLPTIGRGAAKRILDKRPESGYESIQQVEELNPEVTKQPYRVDWSQVQAWKE